MRFDLHPFSLLLALGLAGHGYRKGSLSWSGAITAALVGYLTMANPSPLFGSLLIVFYQTGSMATKVKSNIKANLEHEPKQSHSHSSGTGGNRTSTQVLCNGLSGVLASVLFRFYYSGEFSNDNFHHNMKKEKNIWCPILIPIKEDDFARSLILFGLGHFACCMGDTLASELGILSKRQPRLITNPFRKVPPGTNGGISISGTFFSFLGGFWMGLIFIISLIIGSPSCRFLQTNFILALLFLASLAGLFGSFLDSFLGATLQQSVYNPENKKILIGCKKDLKSVERKGWHVVTGYNVLTNNQVNFISSFVTAILTVHVANYLLP